MIYRLIFDKNGGEFCCGTIERETFDYWCDKENEELTRHIFWGDDSDTDIPQEHNLYPWHEQDDVGHTSGVFLNGGADLGYGNHLSVRDEKGLEVFAISLDSVFLRELCYIRFDKQKYDNDQPVIVTSSIEKGSWEYEVDIQEEFDPKKLRLFLVDLGCGYTLDHIEYDKIDCGLVDLCTRGIEFVARVDELVDDETYKPD